MTIVGGQSQFCAPWKQIEKHEKENPEGMKKGGLARMAAHTPGELWGPTWPG